MRVGSTLWIDDLSTDIILRFVWESFLLGIEWLTYWETELSLHKDAVNKLKKHYNSSNWFNIVIERIDDLIPFGNRPK